ncbi:TPA: hypothetical protein ACGO5E_001469 [Streptococcus suis]
MIKFLRKKPTIEQLKKVPYASQYTEVLRSIWRADVPKYGISSTLQGELLRQLEKLRWEA